LLLLDGLNDQINRLEVIAAGPCDSTGMQQFQHGEIGPIPNSPDSAAPIQTAPSSPTAPDASDNSNASPAQEPSSTAATPPGPTGQMLNPDGLRSLVQQSVVRVLTDNSSGTGFAVAPNIIVTNRHVIEDAGSGDILVTSKFLGNAPIHAKLLFSSANSEIGYPDFAILEMQGGKSLQPLDVGSDPKPLDNVVAAGFPGITVDFDRDSVSPDVVFTQGDVSVVQPQPNGVDLVIHTASIAPGSSGGPLINRCGTVVGVNTFVRTGEQSEGRALFALSPVALAKYLSSVAVTFHQMSSECVAGGG
jgi:serine protease Do